MGKEEEIPLRDLTVQKKVGSDQTGLTESRLTDCLSENKAVHIEDITSSQVQIIDSAEKILKIV